MTMISLHGKRLAKKKRRSVIDHLAGLGFTNENCGADGEGIKYAAAKAAGFTTTNQEGSEESPAI